MPTLSLREVPAPGTLGGFRAGDHRVYIVDKNINRTVFTNMVMNNRSYMVTRQDAQWIAQNLSVDEIEIDLDFYVVTYKLSTDTLVVWYEGLPVFADAGGEINDDRTALADLYQ